jgi:hypothetical protein
LASRHRSSSSREKLTCTNRKSADRFQAGSGRSAVAAPTLNGCTAANAGSAGSARTSSIIARTVSSPVRLPELGLSPYTKRNWST